MSLFRKDSSTTSIEHVTVESHLNFSEEEEEEEAVVVLFYEDDAVDEERVNGVPAVILNAEGAAAQAAEEQMGAEADDEPLSLKCWRAMEVGY